MVTVLPEIIAGPDFTLKVTGKPLEEDGVVTANGASPKALLPMLAKAEMDWGAGELMCDPGTNDALIFSSCCSGARTMFSAKSNSTLLL